MRSPAPTRTRLLLASAVVAGLAFATAPASPAEQTVAPGVVDLGVTLASVPGDVSPPGSLVLLQATVTQGSVATPGTLTVQLPAGSAHQEAQSTTGCTGASTVTCPIGPAGGLVEIVASSPLTVGPMVTTATVASTDPALALVEFSPNNSAQATTTVSAPAAGVAAGLVLEGESISLDLADGRSYTLTVPQGVPGVITEIRGEDGGPRTCGTGSCGNGFVTDFVPHPVFKAEDPANPLLTVKTFGPQPPCNGLGGRCSAIFSAKSPTALAVEEMPRCAGSTGGSAGTGVAAPSPCLNQKLKVDGLIFFDVRMLSNDPMELPPLRL